MERARAHAHVVRLQDQAALFAPERVKAQDHVLQAERPRGGCLGMIGHGPRLWPMEARKSTLPCGGRCDFAGRLHRGNSSFIAPG
jgi:hypothetical protein